MKIIGIVQPSYLPWLPFFERMARADIFIYLDDVKYSKNSFHNRNAIKGPQGRQMLTVPVLYSGHSSALISEIAMDLRTPWQEKHWRTLQQCYSKSRYFSDFKKELEPLYHRPVEKLIDFILPFIELIKRGLSIDTPCYRSSQIPVQGARNEKLVNLCRYFEGTHFIVKPGTEDYHPPTDFLPHGLELHYWKHRTFEYSQLYGAFQPMLSAFDFLFNCGPVDFKKMLAEQYQNSAK
jgi:hypothetical protein